MNLAEIWTWITLTVAFFLKLNWLIIFVLFSSKNKCEIVPLKWKILKFTVSQIWFSFWIRKKGSSNWYNLTIDKISWYVYRLDFFILFTEFWFLLLKIYNFIWSFQILFSYFDDLFYLILFLLLFFFNY